MNTDNQQPVPDEQTSSGHKPVSFDKKSLTPSTTKGNAPTLTIVGLILAALALAISWLPLINIASLILAAAGLTLSLISLKQSLKQQLGTNMAIIGIILSALSFNIAIPSHRLRYHS